MMGLEVLGIDMHRLILGPDTLLVPPSTASKCFKYSGASTDDC